MLKVECESCKAPYQIDERRVPPTGLKMRCPKCGHSFMVASPNAAAPPPPAAGSVGAGQKAEAVRSAFPSDFPAALGSLDEPDLPVVSADLPATKAPTIDLPAAKKVAPRPIKPPPTLPGKPVSPIPAVEPVPFGEIDLDLPAVAAELPDARRPAVPKAPTPFPALGLPSSVPGLPATKRGAEIDLPVIAGELPAVAASLPVVTAQLPSPAASLPSRAAGLPVPSGRGFGELDLPTAAPSLPAVAPADLHLPSPAGRAPEAFGEIELPKEAPIVGLSPPPPASQATSSADFGDLELDDKPRSRGHVSSRPPGQEPGRGGGMTFGEVDLSSAGAPGIDASSISVVAPFPRPPETAAEVPQPARGLPPATVLMPQAPRAPSREAPAPAGKKRSFGLWIVTAVVAATALGGASLQFTAYGAFGYLYFLDHLRAKDYERATTVAVDSVEKTTSVDTYDAAKVAIDAVANAHGQAPRARSLTAYAAFVDFAATTRFGADTSRASRAKQFLSELPADDRSKLRDLALLAQAANAEDPDKARTGFGAALGSLSGPLQAQVAIVLGHIELARKDGNAALAAFRRAAGSANDARVHYGLARAYDMLGDAANAKKEIEATLAVSPQHPGALTLRARMNSAPTEEARAIADLATVLDGPARAKASPDELSRAYAAKAWVSLERGSFSEARDAFARAVQLDPRNVAALGGEGRLFLVEGRYTEALARFDTALQIEPGSPDAIADDAEAKLALERLADSKQQLTDARQRFPKSVAISLLLGRVEDHLGNKDAAEADMRAAVAMVDPAQRNAVLPYVALSELLLSRGRVPDAKAVLDDAKKTLTPSAVLDRALGDVAEREGEHDAAIASYRAAIAKDPRGIGSHFRLAVVLRRTRRFQEAGKELDVVAAVDKDYPGLALERGQLYEESGDVQKAIAEFRNALARAPDDPDLQLRVGSAYVAIGQPDDAIPMLRKVLHERPASAEAHHYLGRALMLKGPSERAEALRSLRHAVDLDPNRVEFHVYLAWAANEADQIDTARDEVERALALDKLDAETYWQKGVLEYKQGAMKDAIVDEKRALELRPSRYEAHATLAECYEQLNDEVTALAEWAKAIAGDGDSADPDAHVRHPYWRYKYGKLLVVRGNAALAQSILLPAATTAEKSEDKPAWLAPLEFYTAQALDKTGHKAQAVDHYRRFLDLAPVTSPDRTDAQKALKRLGAAS